MLAERTKGVEDTQVWLSGTRMVRVVNECQRYYLAAERAKQCYSLQTSTPTGTPTTWPGTIQNSLVAVNRDTMRLPGIR